MNLKGQETGLAAVRPPVVAALRRLAAGIRSDVEDGALAGLFNKVLATVPLLERSVVELGHPGAGREPFGADALTLPLRGDRTLRGILRHPLDAGPLGTVELDTLHAAADLLGALSEMAVRSRELRGLRAAMQLTADRMPFGVVCLGPAGSVLACNQGAASFLGDVLSSGMAGLRELLALPDAPVALTRCVARQGRLGVVHVHPLEGGGPTGWHGAVLLVHDVSESATGFRDAVARETYRCLLEGRDLSLVAVDAPGGVEPLLLAADEIRTALPQAFRCGPLGLEAFGFLLPETSPGSAARFLRGFNAVCQIPGLRIGVASLRGDTRSPDLLIRGALDACGPWDSAMRPELLVFDASPAVTEAVSFVLRADCQVMVANTQVSVRHLAISRVFDGLLLELPSLADEAHLACVRDVLERQPGARPFYLSQTHGPWPLREHGLPEARVFRKPFSVRQMRSAVLEALAEHEPA